MVHPATCECCSKPSAAAQSLEELDFQRSACHFAQSGNFHKLAAAVSAHPASVHSDGIYGKYSIVVSACRICISFSLILLALRWNEPQLQYMAAIMLYRPSMLGIHRCAWSSRRRPGDPCAYLVYLALQAIPDSLPCTMPHGLVTWNVSSSCSTKVRLYERTGVTCHHCCVSAFL